MKNKKRIKTPPVLTEEEQVVIFLTIKIRDVYWTLTPKRKKNHSKEKESSSESLF